MKIFYSAFLLVLIQNGCCESVQISSHSKVAQSSEAADSAKDNGPKVHRAREGVANVDLLFSKVLNGSQSEVPLESGRAIGNGQSFQFPLRNNVLPSNHRVDNAPRVVYSLPVNQVAQDRYTPGEAFAFTHRHKKNGKKESDRQGIEKPIRQVQPQRPSFQPQFSSPQNPSPVFIPTPSPSQVKIDAPPPNPSYVPPKNLYSFPPNSDAVYPTPGDYPSKFPFSSYLPPPAGPTFSILSNDKQPDSDGNGNQSDSMSQSDGSENGGDNGPSPIDDLPSNESQPPMDSPPIDSAPLDFPPISHEHDHDHHDHHHHHPSFDSPPSDLPFDFDPSSLKHSGLTGIDAYPEIVYDHDPHHDYFDHHPHFHHPPIVHVPLPPPTTTLAPLPPPEEPEEPDDQPRVKKYSYFYLSRSLWYIPLYFTVWFTFYVTWLILQSIGRHKVDLPNHTSSRSIRDLSHKDTVEKVNRLTEFVMKQIAEFKDKNH